MEKDMTTTGSVPPVSPSSQDAVDVKNKQRRADAETHCVESYSAYVTLTKDHALENEEESSSGATFWDILLTVYLPIMLLWLRHSMFGVANVIRSLLLGQCVRLFLTFIYAPNSEFWDSFMHHPWIQTVLGMSKDPHSWPPPALTALAVLTVFAFIIHPDGLTWILLGKLRDGIMAFLHSTQACWSFMLQDYGILPTLAALATFAALGCLVWILHRTLTPSPKQTVQREGKKKKKRKGHQGRGGGRSGGCGRALPPHRHRPTHRTIREHNDLSSSDRPLPDITFSPSPPSPPPHDSVDATHSEVPKAEGTPGGTSQKDADARPRVETRDTVTTDDQSCDSASIRSNTSTLVSLGDQSDSVRVEMGEVPLANENPVSRNLKNPQGKRKKKAAATRKGRAGLPRASKSVTCSSKSSHGQQVRTAQAQHNMLPPGRKHAVSSSRRSNHKCRRFPDASPSQVPSRHSPSSSDFGSSYGSSRVDRSNHTGASPNSEAPSSPSLFSQNLVVPHMPPASGSEQSSVDMTVSGNHSYSVSNHTHLSQSDGRYAAGKLELAAFLARVGLVGNAGADLLEDLPNVDALEALSDVQYELYNVTPAEKAEIQLLLDVRRRARSDRTTMPSGSTVGSAVIRPPPGLAPVIGNPIRHVEQQRLEGLPMFPSPSTTMHSYGLEMPSLTPTQMIGNHGIETPSLGQSGSGSLAFSYPVETITSLEDEEESSRIEAELQELGGQMVGSILDS